jgi:DNA processing protein
MPRPTIDEVLAEVRLTCVRGVGPMLRSRLVEAFGSADRVLAGHASDLQAVRGVGAKLAEAILKAPSVDDAARMLDEAAAHGIRVLTLGDDEYPPGLREIPDPPPVLYCRGSIEPQDQRAVAIVGTRLATRYGLRQTERFARDLAAAGVTVVSGLARGVDGVAHRAALDAGGRTIAALAGGLMKIYPPEHGRLADAVAGCGALVAEAAPPMPPLSGSFPQRNRIISGLSLGVLVIEAAERSGALITARHAAEQGRDAFALPGQADCPQSMGCHRLIQEGAKLVTCVEDVLEELDAMAQLAMPSSRPASSGAATRPVERSVQKMLPEVHWDEPTKALLDKVGRDATTIDQLIDETGLPIEQVLAGLSRLEAGGAIRRLSGFTVQLK